VLLAYGLRGTIYTSLDQGSTWSAMPPAMPVAVTACARAPDGRFLLAAASGQVLVLAPDADGPPGSTLQDGAPWPLAGIVLAADAKPVGVGMRGTWRAEQ
jgi:photosystem II stability/assembly factor-like uncharacterized protein